MQEPILATRRGRERERERERDRERKAGKNEKKEKSRSLHFAEKNVFQNAKFDNGDQIENLYC